MGQEGRAVGALAAGIPETMKGKHVSNLLQLTA